MIVSGYVVRRKYRDGFRIGCIGQDYETQQLAIAKYLVSKYFDAPASKLGVLPFENNFFVYTKNVKWCPLDRGRITFDPNGKDNIKTVKPSRK